MVVLATVAALQGCGTVSTKFDRDGWGHPYSGVRCVADGFQGGIYTVVPPFGFVDLVLSFVADTAVLPIDALRYPPERVDSPRCDRFHI
jgi:uncharacterized protein YceK